MANYIICLAPTDLQTVFVWLTLAPISIKQNTVNERTKTAKKPHVFCVYFYLFFSFCVISQILKYWDIERSVDWGVKHTRTPEQETVSTMPDGTAVDYFWKRQATSFLAQAQAILELFRNRNSKRCCCRGQLLLLLLCCCCVLVGRALKLNWKCGRSSAAFSILRRSRSRRHRRCCCCCCRSDCCCCCCY